MKVATYNVNGVTGRLPVLLRWLAEAQPCVACLQELKAPQEKFPEQAIRDAGLRIDHLLLNPAARPRLHGAGVDRHVRGWEKSSDHAPTWVELAKS
jgi:exonuclease III